LIKLVYDIEAIQQGVMNGAYDDKGLQISESKRWKYPSKLMIVKLLEPLFENELKDIDGTANVWSIRKPENGTEKITLVIEYKAK